jgi:Bardet-Biedl syndrome 1 protein
LSGDPCNRKSCEAKENVLMEPASRAMTWRVAFSDKTTGVAAVPQCLTSGDVFGDGSHRILIVSLEQKLICFEGQRMTHELALPDMPSSICVHYNGKSTGDSEIPLVAVGAGNGVFFFLNLRQYAKFTLPPPYCSPDEAHIYDEFRAKTLTLVEAQQELRRARERDIPLCPQSLVFLQADLSSKAVADGHRQALEDLSATDCVTALAVIKANALDTNRTTRLLVGTESRSLLLLAPTDTAVEKKWELDSPASVIRTSGFMAGASTIVVVARDRTIRMITNLSTVNSIRCESLPIDVAICSDCIYLALMSGVVQLFDAVGKSTGCVAFDSHIISLVAVEISNRQLPCCCVATENGELTFIVKTERISTLGLDEGVSALYFGIVGREPYNLLSISKHGGLFLRTLSRIVGGRAEGADSDDKGDPPPPLPIPKKTKLFVDHCEAEKTGHREMYREWRNSLRYLKLLAANTYAQILEDSVVSPMDSVSFAVKVLGMGPDFVMNVTTSNTAPEPVTHVKLIPRYNPKIYRITPDFVDLPTMVAGCSYTGRFIIESLDREGKSDVVNLVPTCPQFTIPLCSSIVQVPVSQFPINAVA